MRRHTIVHELLHALGFYHEQSRPDRDLSVTIEWDNVEDDASSRYQFRLADGSDTLGTPYDYTSIMHYGPCSFTKCSSCSSDNASCRTITTLNPAFQSIIGNRSNFGTWDIEDLRRVYGDGVARYADSSGPISVVGSLAQPYADMNSASRSASARRCGLTARGATYARSPRRSRFAPTAGM